MTYLLDTSICVLAMRRHAGVEQRLGEVGPGACAVSVITAVELWFGARISRYARKNRASVDAFLAPLRACDFEERAAEAFVEVRYDLRRRGTPIGDFDLLIAATALARGLTVVTNNAREFKRVRGLSVEDWAG